MADLAIVASNVIIIDGTEQNFVASTLLIAGTSVFVNSNNQAAPALATTEYVTFGITVNDADFGQPVGVLTLGTIALGETLLQGMQYGISINSGKIAPITDIITGQYFNILGYANDTDQLVLFPFSIPFALG
jgi:hypothetical protein